MAHSSHTDSLYELIVIAIFEERTEKQYNDLNTWLMTIGFILRYNAMIISTEARNYLP